MPPSNTISLPPFVVDFPSGGCARVKIGECQDGGAWLAPGALTSFERVLTRIEALISLRGMIIENATPGRPPAVLDHYDFECYKTTEEVREAARRVGRLFDRIVNMPWNTVAVIDGPCLGPAFELALACKTRIATDSSRTRAGLPQVLLGLTPGFGGARRMAQLIGFEAAIDLLLSGRRLRPRRMLELGLVDWCVAPADLESTAIDLAEGRLLTKTRTLPWTRRWFHESRTGRALVARRIRAASTTRSAQNYPAPRALVDSLQKALSTGGARAFELECEAFASLWSSRASRELRRIYRTTEQCKQLLPGAMRPSAGSVAPQNETGRAIALLLASKGVDVHISDPDPAALDATMAEAGRRFGTGSGRGEWSLDEARAALLRIHKNPDFTGIDPLHFMIDATPGGLLDSSIHFESVAPVPVFITSQTVTISAAAAVLPAPALACGLHFSVPVEGAALVEIVKTSATGPAIVETGRALALLMGKTPLVVADVPGGCTMRFLFTYFSAGILLLREGLSILQVDAAAASAGFPLGPFSMLDRFGLVAARERSQFLTAAHGHRFHLADALTWCIEAGRLGGTGGGFYESTRPATGIGRILDIAWAGAAAGPANAQLVGDAGEILTLTFTGEAQRILAEKVVPSADLADLAGVLGAGYPAFRGGPLRDWYDRMPQQRDRARRIAEVHPFLTDRFPQEM